MNILCILIFPASLVITRCVRGGGIYFLLRSLGELVYSDKSGKGYKSCEYIAGLFPLDFEKCIEQFLCLRKQCVMLIPFSISVIFLLAGFVQGMTGFGSALVAMPLLSLCIDVKSAVPLCTLNNVVITTFLVLRLRKHLDRRKILPLCLAAVPGMFAGITLLKKVDSASLSIGLGVLLIAYSCYSLRAKYRPRTIHPAWSYMAGFLSGAIGAAFSAGGPPTIIYATQSEWNKDEIKATLSGFFLFNSYLNATAHAVSGMTTISVLSSFLYAAPCVLLGTVLGSHCYGCMERVVYLKVIFTFLILMGTMMIVTAW